MPRLEISNPTVMNVLSNITYENIFERQTSKLRGCCHSQENKQDNL